MCFIQKYFCNNIHLDKVLFNFVGKLTKCVRLLNLHPFTTWLCKALEFWGGCPHKTHLKLPLLTHWSQWPQSRLNGSLLLQMTPWFTALVSTLVSTLSLEIFAHALYGTDLTRRCCPLHAPWHWPGCKVISVITICWVSQDAASQRSFWYEERLLLGTAVAVSNEMARPGKP